MLTYFLQVNLCWLLFYGLYYVLLSRETFFKLNRIYLIISLLCGLVLPFSANWLRTETVLMIPLDSIMLPTFVVGMQEQTLILPQHTEGGLVWSWGQIILGIYWLGVGVLGLRFLKGLYQIFSIFKAANIEKDNGFLLVNTVASERNPDTIGKEVLQPFSFFNFIFINPNQFQNIEYQDIMQHEKAHVQQGHSYDVVFLELLNIIFWCSPLVYLYKNSLRTVHEYLADAAVLRSVSKKQYGTLLIRQAQSGTALAFANPFFSQLKKRIVMMTRNPSKRRALVKYALVAPLFLLLVSFLASPNNVAMKKTEKISQNVINPAANLKLPSEIVDISSKNSINNDLIIIEPHNQEEPYIRISVEGRYGRGGVIPAGIFEALCYGGGLLVGNNTEKMYRISQFQMYKINNNGIISNIVLNEGAAFNDAVKELGKDPQIGDEYFFNNILVQKKGEKELQNFGNLHFMIGHDERILQNYMWALSSDELPALKFPNGKVDASAVVSPNTGKDTLPVLTKADELPEYPDGLKAMFRFLAENIKYPTKSRENGFQGTVYVGFVVEIDGSISNIHVKRGVKEIFRDTVSLVVVGNKTENTAKIVETEDHLLDNEAKRVVAMMPKWRPGKNKGEVARVAYTLPIKFILE